VAALHPGARALFLFEQFGELFEHDAGQLFGVDDRHRAAVIADHGVTDGGRNQLDLLEPLVSESLRLKYVIQQTGSWLVAHQLGQG
jgi:hypothetical protein